MKISHMTECLAFKRDRHSARTVHPVDQMRNKGKIDAAAKPERMIGEDRRRGEVHSPPNWLKSCSKCTK